DFQNELMRTLNTTTTQTLVNAANRLVDEVPRDMSADEVGMHFMISAAKEDAARGVIWPQITMEHFMKTGHDWHIFPNMVILFAHTFVLGYRARPNGDDPNSCVFEVYALERYPEGQEPKTEWEFLPEPTEDNWLLVLTQDFNNMAPVQKGMK